MNEVIIGLQQKLNNMKSLVPTEAATPEQVSKYFNETEELIDGILLERGREIVNHILLADIHLGKGELETRLGGFGIRIDAGAV